MCVFYMTGRNRYGVQGVHLNPPGPLPMHLLTVYTGYSECLPTLLHPLAERTSVSPRYKLTQPEDYYYLQQGGCTTVDGIDDPVPSPLPSSGRVCHQVPISTERAQRCIRSQLLVSTLR
jgi:hypothetical protein